MHDFVSDTPRRANADSVETNLCSLSFLKAFRADAVETTSTKCSFRSKGNEIDSFQSALSEAEIKLSSFIFGRSVPQVRAIAISSQ